jgi:hypothetical protein
LAVPPIEAPRAVAARVFGNESKRLQNYIAASAFGLAGPARRLPKSVSGIYHEYCNLAPVIDRKLREIIAF